MITILALGKAKALYKPVMTEYFKRMHSYAKVQLVESSNYKNLKGTIVTLEECGKEFDSKEFAKFVKKVTLENKDVTFVIGEAHGIPEDIKKQANHVISLSKMTMPNQLAKVVFIEQLYRAFTIIKGEPYHKE